MGEDAFTPQIASGFATIRAAAGAVGRPTDKPYTVGLTSGCVMREGESLTSPRVIERFGTGVLGGIHRSWESHYGTRSSSSTRSRSVRRSPAHRRRSLIGWRSWKRWGSTTLPSLVRMLPALVT
jgi:hypothetical protein